MITASAIPRILACPNSYALPQVRTPSTPEARQGTSVHAFLFLLHNGVPREDALLAVDEAHREYCSKIDLRPVPGALAEIALAYDVESGRARLLAGVTDRAYGELAPTEIAGTCDLFIPATADQIATVADWKTTHSVGDVQQYLPQLEFYALALARAHRLSKIRIEIVAIDDTATVHYPVQRHLDWEDLALIARRVLEGWTAAQDAKTDRAIHEAKSAAPWVPDVVEGQHCTWCPGWRSCPAKRAVLGAVGATPEPNGSTYLQVQALERWAQLGRDVIREAVTAGGSLPIDDAREVRLDRRHRLSVARRREP